LPESVDIESGELQGDEYITVYLNPDQITVTDIDDVEEAD
jgi:hypothetical protein